MPVDASAVAALAAEPMMAPLRPSLEHAYGDPARAAAWADFFARFLGPGDVVFDVGAHVGDRTDSFRRLGARVVAVEPQPLCSRALRRLYAGDAQVTVLQAACAARAEPVDLHVNRRNPTVSTLSQRFVAAADGAGGWEGQRWDARLRVACVTLDGLITAHGRPAFVKIDVEGFEDQVLTGLSCPLPALSFEFTTIRREVALRCLDYLAQLGPYGFDAVLGDGREFAFGQWVSGDQLAAYLRRLPHEANSGDVYCLAGPPGPDSGGGT